jgi:hypothetical protein
MYCAPHHSYSFIPSQRPRPSLALLPMQMKDMNDVRARGGTVTRRVLR